MFNFNEKNMEPLQTYGGKPLINNQHPFTETVELAALIEMSGLKASFITSKLDITHNTYLKMLSDPKLLKVVTIIELSQILRVPADYIFACAMLTISNQTNASQRAENQQENH